MLSIIMSTVCAVAFTGSAVHPSRVVAPQMLSAKAVSSFECGMCGGMADGCPMCRAPTPAAYKAFSFDVHEEMDTKSSFDCELCGGLGEGCPMCHGPSPASFKAFSFE